MACMHMPTHTYVHMFERSGRNGIGYSRLLFRPHAAAMLSLATRLWRWQNYEAYMRWFLMAPHSVQRTPPNNPATVARWVPFKYFHANKLNRKPMQRLAPNGFCSEKSENRKTCFTYPKGEIASPSPPLPSLSCVHAAALARAHPHHKYISWAWQQRNTWSLKSASAACRWQRVTRPVSRDKLTFLLKCLRSEH